MQAGLGCMGYSWTGTDYRQDTGFADPVPVETLAFDWVASDPVLARTLVYGTYMGIGPSIAAATDLTGRLYNLRKSGFGKKIKDVPIPGSRKTIKIHQGVEGPIYTASVGWGADRNAADAFLQAIAAIDNDGTRFYNRDSLWYHKVYWAESEPDPQIQTWIWQHGIKLYLTDPYRYSEIHQEWNVTAGTLPQVSEAMDDYGHVADGFESISITGHYNWLGLGHMEDVVLSVADGYSMTLSDHLLKDEVITLEVDGSLSTSWTCALYNLAHFIADAPAYTGVTFDTDHIAIAASGYAIIALTGPWPTKKPVKMTATLTPTGTASVQVSTDGGATYADAVTYANIESGVSAVYYLTGSGKAADIKIKFNCPAGSSMLIHALKIERELDCSGADLPVVQPGAAKAFTVSCDIAKSTSATIAAEYHPRREAI